MNIHDFLRSYIHSGFKKPIPVLSFPCVQLMDTSVLELVQNSDLQAKGMKMVADRIDSGASVSFMDLSVEAECFGSAIQKYDAEVPAVSDILIHSLNEANELSVPSPTSKRAGTYLKAIQKAKEEITDRPVFAGVIGPYSLAGRLVGVSESMLYCFDSPEMMHIVLEKCTDFLIQYILEYKKIGADGVVMAEPLAGLLSPSLVEEFSEPYVKKIIDAVKDDNFAIIYHNCGNAVVQMIDGILRVGADAYHFGNAIDILDVLTLVPKDTIIMGNIDPAGLFRNGTPERMKEAVYEILDKCAEYPNFVLSSGCDIPPMASWENIDAFFDANKTYFESR